METFDLSGARAAAEAGQLHEWLVALLRREPGANRSLAAMLKGHRPWLEGPVQVPLDSLEQLAGPDPACRYPKDPVRWAEEIAPMIGTPPEAMPPLLIRETAGERHLSDGNHRLDAWRRRGETHGWAIVWRDRDPAYIGHWSPFPPARTPRFELVETANGFLPLVDDEGLVLAAKVGDEIVGAVRLVPEFDGLTLRTMRVHPDYRGYRVGARLLAHLQPHMDGRTVHCLAFPWLERFYGEFGFRPVAPAELPDGLRRRYESFLDEKGCLPMRRDA